MNIPLLKAASNTKSGFRIVRKLEIEQRDFWNQWSGAEWSGALAKAPYLTWSNKGRHLGRLLRCKSTSANGNENKEQPGTNGTKGYGAGLERSETQCASTSDKQPSERGKVEPENQNPRFVCQFRAPIRITSSQRRQCFPFIVFDWGSPLGAQHFLPVCDGALSYFPSVSNKSLSKCFK